MKKNSLEKEADFLIKSLNLEKHYDLLSGVYIESISSNVVWFESGCSFNIEKVIDLKLDIDSLELFLRLNNKNNSLTKRVKILSFAKETMTAYEYKENIPWLQAFIELSKIGLITAYKLAKGGALYARYRRVIFLEQDNRGG